jgi:CheY-like chemotaxis protein
VPDLRQPRIETGISNRRRAHVDAAPPGPEVESGTNHSDFLTKWLHDLAGKASFLLMSEGDAASGTIRVLLADDDRPFVEALVPLLERQPELAVVGSAEDGLAAIEQAEALRPDAIVIDLHMPLVDGVTAVARLRKDHPSMCVIALTGDAQPELHRAVTEAGADAVLVKEEFVDVLLERLASAKVAATPR